MKLQMVAKSNNPLSMYVGTPVPTYIINIYMNKRLITRTILGVTIVATLSACNNDVLLDEEQHTKESLVAIGFDNSFVDNAVGTRATTLKLSEYAQSMGVWGWQKDENAAEEQLFKNHMVEYNGTKWEYAPLKYWDTASTYRFYAYAPHSAKQKGNSAAVALDKATGMISISNVKLQGDNLQETNAGAEQKKTFITASNDVDWMVARTGQTATGSSHAIVEFTMQHVLAKLNARIRISDVLATDAGIKDVKVNSMTIGKLAADGSFKQQHYATQAATAVEQEWTTGDDKLTLSGTTDFTVTTKWQYMLESLVIPQAIPNAEIQFVYSFVFTDGRTEYYTYRISLAEVFNTITHFVSGNSYTISFTIAPDVIKFDAGTSSWIDIYNI